MGRIMPRGPIQDPHPKLKLKFVFVFIFSLGFLQRFCLGEIKQSNLKKMLEQPIYFLFSHFAD